MSTVRRKAPSGTYWRGNTLWGSARIKGKHYRWSLKTDDPKLAKERRQAGKDRVIAISKGDAKRSFAEVTEEWLEWLETQVGHRTADRYACSMAQLSPWLKDRQLYDVDGKFVATLIVERGKQVSSATLKRDLGALSSVFNYAMFRGYCEDNPILARMRLVKERRDPIVLPQEKDIQLAISRAPGMMGQLMQAAIVTGCRQSELRLSRHHHLDTERGQLTVIGKGNKMRVIDLAPYDGRKVFNALPSYSEARDRYLFWHDNKGRAKAYGDDFKSNFAKFIERTAKWADKNGIEFQPFAFHHLRHLHAVRFLKDGYGTIYDLRERLGHTSVSTTEVYLSYLTPEERLRAKHSTGSSTNYSTTEVSKRATGVRKVPVLSE